MTRRWLLWLVAALVALTPAAAARADGPPKLVKDLLPGQDSGSPHDLTAYKGALYFTGADAGGFGLWRSDGTDVTLFQRTNSGAGFTVAGDTLYFAAEDAANGLELWRSEGGAPALVKDLEPGTGGSGPRALTAAGALVYFEAVTTAGGRALWRSDGTAAGPVPPKSFGANQGLSSLTAVGSLLFFVANDGTHGRELWRSDGTPAGTFMVRDIDLTGGSAPTMLTPFGAQLVFAATDPDHGTELWRSDGTSAT